MTGPPAAARERAPARGRLPGLLRVPPRLSPLGRAPPRERAQAGRLQAEAERERRAKIIHAEGEAEAAQNLEKAAAIMASQPAALQLRYLQTLVEIGSEKNTTVVFPLPMDILSNVGRILEKLAKDA